MAVLKWDAAVRAEHYRVWMRVQAVDTDFIAVGSPVDLNFTLENLSANATIGIVARP